MAEGLKIKICRLLILLTIFILGTAILAMSFVCYLKHDKSRSSTIKLSMMDATLTQFNYTNKIISYNLTLDIMLHHIVYHDHINASVMYQKVKFGSQTMEAFNKSFTRLNICLEGQHVMELSTNQIEELYKEMRYGVYHFNVMLCSKPSYHTKKLNPIVCCDL